jgi:hypothetical protein
MLTTEPATTIPPPVERGGGYTPAPEGRARAVLAALGAGDVRCTRDPHTRDGKYISTVTFGDVLTKVMIEASAPAAPPVAPPVAPERVAAAHLVLDDHGCPDCLNNAPCGAHADLIRRALAAADKAGEGR